MKIVLNRHRKTDHGGTGIHDLIEPINFHSRLPGYKPTPLIDHTELADELKVKRIFIKDEGQRFGLKAFKALGASYAIFCLLREKSGGKLREDDFLESGRKLARGMVFTTATDGNHGRAVAWTARLLGCPAIIYMPEGTVEARVNAIKNEGAEVIIIKGSYDQAVMVASEKAKKHGRTVIQDTGYEGYLEIPANIQRGYYTMFIEIEKQLSTMNIGLPDIVFIQSGVGAFAAAAADFFGRVSPRTHLISVEPVCADCLLVSASTHDGTIRSTPGECNTIMAGLNCGTPSLTAWGKIANSFHAFIAIEDEWSRKAMRLFAKHGIVSGESGAAGLGALLALLSEKSDAVKKQFSLKNSNILVINTEGDTDPVSYKEIISDLGGS